MSLQLQSVGKRYKGETVLSDINLDIDTGKTLVLFGPSGGGKSVLLRLIAGVIDPDQGQVLIDGQDMREVDPEDRGIGMAFQNFALFPHMSARENISSSLEVTEPSKARLRDAVDSVARLLKIDHVLEHAPRALSNGQKQRTALARALVGSPSLLLLDDPLRNVDAKLRFEMRLELPVLLARAGTTVVYVTQDYKEAMALGHQIAVLDNGVVQQTGTPEEIYLQPATIAVARQFGDPVINLLEVVPQLDETGLFVNLSGCRIDLDGFSSREVEARDCVLGLRPESLQFTDADSAISVDIEASTPLNEKIITLAQTSGQRELLISRPSNTPGPEQGKARIAIDAARLLLFDRDSGQRLRRQHLAPNATPSVTEVPA